MSATVITVTSGKGGVGKTTATANISAALAAMGKKVVAIDADIGLRNLDVVMGLENRIVYNLVDVVEGSCRLRQAMIKDKRLADLHLIPAAQSRDKAALTPGDMIAVVDQMRDEFDFIIIDSPAGIEQGFKNAVAPADRVLVITTPEVSAVRDADRIIGLVESEGKNISHLVVNRIRPDMVRRGDMLNTDDVVDVLAIELIGIVPDDEAIVISTNQGRPAVLENGSLAGQAFRNIASRIDGQSIPFLDLDQTDSFMQRLSKLFKR
jgi:septum site-determining protein MinD